MALITIRLYTKMCLNKQNILLKIKDEFCLHQRPVKLLLKLLSEIFCTHAVSTECCYQ